MVRGSRPAKVQEWSERLVRFRESDLTVARFCQVEGVSTPSFYQWKSRLQDRLAPEDVSHVQPALSAKRSRESSGKNGDRSS